MVYVDCQNGAKKNSEESERGWWPTVTTKPVQKRVPVHTQGNSTVNYKMYLRGFDW